MKFIAALLIAAAFLIGYWQGYQHAYGPLHDKLQAIQAEDWQRFNPSP